MAVLTIRGLDDATMTRLRLRAALHSRAMEDEARDILRSALSMEVRRPGRLGQAIHPSYGALGGVNLLDPLREAIRAPADFGD